MEHTLAQATEKTSFRPIRWVDGGVELIDQTLLPLDEVWLRFDDYRDVAAAVREMKIRGAPAIGVAGAYALALAAAETAGRADADFMSRLERAGREIAAARPTAVNLAWAVDRMLDVARRKVSGNDTVDAVVGELIEEAKRIQDEDEAANVRMGEFGAVLLPEGGSILTHCNTGALATGGFGTALGVIRTAWSQGRIAHVYATETRPFMQGARLTAWELVRAKIDSTLIPDSAAGQLMRRGKVHAVILGADRIAANGDVANKIGTYSLAVLARQHGIPFYVAAPTSTIDLSLPSGDDIPIEERPAEEVTHIYGRRIVPEGIGVLNTAFDVTPHELVTAIVTENGVAQGPYTISLKNATEGTLG
ncbi:MAG: S-methyl-5-thioribose-1-phosphate isomerase [Chloroflexi bacterium]|nr:S-methyl-5-thioribose-1-phosphate isomerase [Chloroflexota bacterium]